MKLFKKTKLNTKGFSHVELLIVIVVVVVIGVIGVVVYKHDNKKTSVAHAGGWTVIGHGQLCTNIYCTKYISYTGEACFLSNQYGTFVRGLAITNSPIPQNYTDTIISRTTRSYGGYVWQSTPTTGWLYGTVNETAYLQVNLSHSNYITISIGGDKDGSFDTSTATAPAAGSLATC